MSNNIGSFNAAQFHPYQRLNPSADESAGASQSAREQDAAREVQQSSAPSESQAPAEMQELSTAEQEMIQQKFPQDPDLSMRLYGRNRDTEQVNPGTLGQNLDVRG